MNYYVYGITVNNVIIYVGKGRGNRKDHHLKNFLRTGKAVNNFLKCKFINAIKNNHVIDTIILEKNLSQEQALQKEKDIINSLGKKCNGGSLCNVTDGGIQPPTADNLRATFGEEVYKEIKQRQLKTTRERFLSRISKFKTRIENMLIQNLTYKDIAIELKINKATLRRWINELGIKIYTKGKEIKINEHLKKWREINKVKPQKTSKEYEVVNPNGELNITRFLVQYCKENKIDYSNLRATFKRGGKCKGFYIKNIKTF